MVCTTTGRVDETAGDTGDQELVLDVELHDSVELLLAVSQHAIKLLRLRNSTGETIQDKSVSDVVSD